MIGFQELPGAPPPGLLPWGALSAPDPQLFRATTIGHCSIPTLYPGTTPTSSIFYFCPPPPQQNSWRGPCTVCEYHSYHQKAFEILICCYLDWGGFNWYGWIPIKYSYVAIWFAQVKIDFVEKRALRSGWIFFKLLICCCLVWPS